MNLNFEENSDMNPLGELEFLRFAISQAAIVATTDKKGIITYVNDKFCEISKYSREELLGKTHRIIKSNFHSKEFFKNMWDTIKNGKIWKGEILNRAKDGTYYWVDTTIVPSKDKNGIIQRFLAIRFDITRHKHLEEMLQSSIEQKEVLLKEIQHRVKNNLLVITGILDWQKDYIEGSDFIKIIEKSQNRINSMVLIYDKLYQSQELNLIDLSDYLETLLGQLLHSYEVKSGDINLKMEVPSIFINIETAIPTGLIICEIFSNAIEHAFPNRVGDIILQILIENERKIKLIFKDNGVGLPNEFDIKNSKTLGLQLIRLLTEQLEGEIEIFSNQGTTFKLTFSELSYQTRI